MTKPGSFSGDTSGAQKEIWLWRILIVGTLLSVIGFGIAALMLAHGAADPPRAGALEWSDHAMVWAGGAEWQPLAASQSLIFTSPHPLPGGGFTLDIQATLADASDPMAAWGVWLETGDGSRTIIAINGAQYVTARRCPRQVQVPLETCNPLIEPTQRIQTVWKVFRHIHPRGEPNTLRLDSQPQRWSGGVTLRLNHEWMWDIPYSPPPESPMWGLWARGGPATAAYLRWIQVEIWAAG
jgi:hypothetical protein